MSSSGKENNVLVTGGAGFIGSHIAVSLIATTGYNVVVLDDLSGGFLENIPLEARFVQGSILDAYLVRELFEEFKFKYVFHVAAYAAEGLSHFIRNFNYTNNLLGSVNLINNSILHGCRCFVFTSSIAVYGSGQTPMREDMVPQPEDPYGISKYAVELDLEAAKNMFDLNYIIFRPHNVYGERQNIGDPYRNVIGIFMNQILQKKPCTIFGDGMQTRAFSYIDDVSHIIAKSVEFLGAYNQIFNIGADTPYSVNSLAVGVQRVMEKELGLSQEAPGVVYLPARKEVLHAFSDHEKLHRVFGTYPTPVSLDEGLQRMAAWVSRVGSRRSKSFEKIEVDCGLLPESWRKLWTE